MLYQKQLFRHAPEKGIYGDCYRTALACILDERTDQVPHFYDKGVEAEEALQHIRKWMSRRGLALITTTFDGGGVGQDARHLEEVLGAVAHHNPNMPFLLSGRSPSGCNHTVAFDHGKMWDPSPANGGIVGPTAPDGFYWVEFIGLKFRS